MGEFSLRGLSVLAYANGFTHWHYKMDSIADAIDPRFFAAASDMLSAGDVILISARDGARHVCVVADGPGLLASPLLK